MAEPFAIGDPVEKIGGRYGGPGKVVGIADEFADGHRLYLVAHRIAGGFGEFVHVYPASNLQPISEERNMP